MRKLLALLVAAAALLVAAVLAPAGADGALKRRATVSVDNDFFAPTRVTIRRRGIVKWDWVGGGDDHNIANSRGVLSRTTNDPDYVFSKRFRRRGKFRFFCAVHPDYMRMRVVVR